MTPMSVREVERSAPCPVCKAAAGQTCINLDGTPRQGKTCNPHKPRWDAAWKVREAQSVLSPRQEPSA